jgi:hypothetical protein
VESVDGLANGREFRFMAATSRPLYDGV